MDKIVSKLMPYNELYFGRSPELNKAQECLGVIRLKYANNPSDVFKANIDKSMIKFNRYIENFYGFGCFALNIVYDIDPWVITVPIGFNFTNNKDKNFIVNKNTYRFNKEAGYICLINISSALLFNPEVFTNDEIMAAIVREIGHSFYACMYGGSAILNNIYGAASICNIITSVVHAYNQAKGIGKAIKDHQINLLSQNYDEFVANFMKAIVPDNISQEEYNNTVQTLVNAKVLPTREEFGTKEYEEHFIKAGGIVGLINKSIKLAGLGMTAFPFITDFTQSQEYKNTIDQLQYGYENNESFNTPINIFFSYLKVALDKIGAPVLNTFDSLLTWSLSNKDKALNISSFIKQASLELFLPFTSFIRRSKNPLTWIMMPIGYDKEESASAFCTMYGYGSDYISYANKVKTNSAISKLTKKAPFVGILFDLISAPAKILNNIYDPSPTGISLQLSQIQLLKAELGKMSLDPKMKAMIQQDIKACENNIAKATSLSKGVSDPDICKHLADKMLYDILSNTIGNSKLTSNRFNRYDNI